MTVLLCTGSAVGITVTVSVSSVVRSGSGEEPQDTMAIKKLKHEKELLKKAIEVGVVYAEKRGAARFEPTDSAEDKVLFLYRLLVHDRLIQPLPEDQVSQQTMEHKLALWYARQLPEGHPLLG